MVADEPEEEVVAKTSFGALTLCGTSFEVTGMATKTDGDKVKAAVESMPGCSFRIDSIDLGEMVAVVSGDGTSISGLKETIETAGYKVQILAPTRRPDGHAPTMQTYKPPLAKWGAQPEGSLPTKAEFMAAKALAAK